MYVSNVKLKGKALKDKHLLWWGARKVLCFVWRPPKKTQMQSILIYSFHTFINIHFIDCYCFEGSYCCLHLSLLIFIYYLTAMVGQCVRALAPQAEGWVLESKPRQTEVEKTGGDSSTAKRSTIVVSATGPRR